MVVFLVRHACAGHKEDWDGPDDERPLDPAGARQAEELAGRLGDREVRRLVSSPTRRCIDTLAPLADRRGLRVEVSERLGTDASADELLALVVDPAHDGAAFCTHGELLEDVLDRFRQDGVPVEGARPDDDEWLLLKGSAWELRVDGGAVRQLQHVVTEPLTACPHHP